MMEKAFNTTLADSQATPIHPISPGQFDINAYADYEESLQARCRKFWKSNSGVLVYRRMRVAEVFSYGSKDMQHSLACQLGALKHSVSFKSDVPNFLEPWYGIGTIASAYGIDYQWADNQAPMVMPLFKSVSDALQHSPEKVASTKIGKHILQMIEYFLDQTKGRLPISLTDTQSPLNTASYIVDSTNFMLDLVINPDPFKQLLDRMSDLAITFTSEQLELLQSVVVWPGHGFASSRQFEGIGMSDDNMLMLSGTHYQELCAPAVEKFGGAFNGPAFHSCGNWANRIEQVRSLKNLKTVDGAFSAETDPAPNAAEPFQTFADSGIVVNARIVGDVETITHTVKKLWKPGMKLIVTTYCETPEEQAIAYEHIYQICQVS
jgi:hypothetical protein